MTHAEYLAITADSLKDYFETLLDDMTFHGEESKTCMAMTLMSVALGAIDWDELADHYLAKVKERV